MDYYTTHAQRLSNQYNSLSPEAVHSTWLPHLPNLSNSQFQFQSITANRALDIGAGSGRDASWLAAKGWNVVAVEPAAGLSRLGGAITRGQNVFWLDDSLPELLSLRNNPELQSAYDFILVSAVWMHLTPEAQRVALQRLNQLAAPGAVVVITWRNQADESERVFHEVDVNVFANGLFTQKAFYSSGDEGGRDGVVWNCIVLEPVVLEPVVLEPVVLESGYE